MAHPDDSDRYYSLFEDAPVGIWEEDFSEVKSYLDEIAASGIRDIAELLQRDLNVVSECTQRVKVLHVNRVAREFYGASTTEELIALLPSFFDQTALLVFRDELVAFVRNNRTFEAEFPVMTLGSGHRIVHMNVSLLPTPESPWSRVLVAFTDLTEQRRRNLDSQHARQLDSLGRLAGGVAHDLNNTLTVINGYTDMLLNDLPEDMGAKPSLEEIRQAGMRAAHLAHQLLAFGRRQLLIPEVIDCNSLVAGSDSTFRAALGERIALEVDLDSALCPTRADPGQLREVLLNLVLNARDAMPHGGRVRMWTANRNLGEEEAAQIGLTAGPYVTIGVCDSGTGMDEETAARVFEPFFTTKKGGAGAGLGLASAFGIVKQSGGSFTVDTELGAGSSFVIYLPRVKDSVCHDEDGVACISSPEQDSAQ